MCDPDAPAFFPEERIDVETVVQGYTNNAAGAWRGDVTGSLSQGKFADLIIVDRDIFNVDAFELGATEVQLTVLEGADVHRADGFDG